MDFYVKLLSWVVGLMWILWDCFEKLWILFVVVYKCGRFFVLWLGWVKCLCVVFWIFLVREKGRFYFVLNIWILGWYCCEKFFGVVGFGCFKDFWGCVCFYNVILFYYYNFMVYGVDDIEVVVDEEIG